MRSILDKDSLLRKFVDKLIIVDISLRKPDNKNTEKMSKLMEKMIEISDLKLRSREEILKELKAEESDINVINFLMLNLIKNEADGTFSFKNLELNYLKSAWPLLQSTWPVEKELFEPWNGPALFLKGQTSEYISGNDANEIRQLFPLADIQTISKAGHWPHFDNRDEFLKKVTEFLVK